jgi:hypothetical protein
MVSSGMLRRVVLTRATRLNIPEDTILHSHHRENLKYYNANVVPSSPFLVTLMMGAVFSSETSVLIRPLPHHIPEDGIRHSGRGENFKCSLS